MQGYIIIQYGFPRFWGKNWRRSEHAHASYHGLCLLSPARVQPLYGAGRKESSGTGLEGAKKQKRIIIEMGGGGGPDFVFILSKIVQI